MEPFLEARRLLFEQIVEVKLREELTASGRSSFYSVMREQAETGKAYPRPIRSASLSDTEGRSSPSVQRIDDRPFLLPPTRSPDIG